MKQKLQITNHKLQTNHKSQITNYKKGGPRITRINTNFPKKRDKNNDITTTKGSYDLHRDSLGLQSMTALIKSFCGGLNQWVSKQMTAESASNEKFLLEMIMVPRLHPGANENRHQRFAQHIGSPRRGAGGQG